MNEPSPHAAVDAAESAPGRSRARSLFPRLACALGIIAGVVVPGAPGLSRGALVDGLAHHWNFDEAPDWHDDAFGAAATNLAAGDLVGSAHATLQNMGAANWVSGRQFKALAFDGATQRLSVGTNLAATLGGTASLSFWIQTVQTGQGTPPGAPGIAGTSAAGGTQWGLLDDTGRVGLGVDNAWVVRSRAPLNDGRWHHLVLTRDAASGAAQVFVDGALSESATGPAGLRGAAFSSLGRVENGGYFKGRLDQVHVFGRVLAASEVSTLLTNHAPKTWEVAVEGVNNRPFSTPSVLFRAYDVERGALTVGRWTQPARGSVSYNGDGSFTYTPAGGYLGRDAFEAIVQDGAGGFRRSRVQISLVSEPPGGGGVPVTQFAGFSPLQAGGADISHSGWRVPRVVDWNADGRLDLLVGAGGSVWLYANTGTAQNPAFAAATRLQAGGGNINSGTTTSPIALADLTGDGVKDLALADSAGKLRVYRNTAAAGATPVLASPVFARHANGTDFVLADRRFDLGDWNGDGKPDLITGTFSGDVQVFLNSGTAADPRFSTGTIVYSGSYQIYPRLTDLNGNGLIDFLRGINWGDVVYWRDAGSRGLNNGMTLTIQAGGGGAPDLHALTDGPVVDFGDLNGDGKADLVVGGHASDKVYVAWGVLKTVSESLAEIEAIYDANPANPGVALSANNNALLNQVNAANWNLISRIQNGTLGTRETLFAALSNHVAKYWFLKYQTLDTTNYHHVPGIALQNWVMLHSALPDTPAQRTNIAGIMGLAGVMRAIYLESGLALGDNAKSIPAAYGTIRDFLGRHPRELFPDAVLTIDQLYGDGRGGFVWTPNSTKNTFGDWAVGLANEWAGDLTAAIEKVLGPGAASGDYFTFVMGHEVTHSLDGYVNSRPNSDLRKRWGLALCTAAGPDIVPGADGWWDWTATKSRFQARGYWNGVEASWNGAWSNYWSVGAGAAFRNTSFMRGNIDWFMGSPQESLATQANHHWANGPGRLVGAVDRFRRASAPGLAPLRANINEVVTFIDFLSAGMNRVNLVETKTQSSPKQVNWLDHYADLERDDRGYIRRITVDGRRYELDVGTNGVVTNVVSSVLRAVNDTAWTFRDQPRRFAILDNDSRLEGGPVRLLAAAAPAHGTVAVNPDGTVVYSPAAGYVGNDRFDYTIDSDAGGNASATVFVEVINPAAATGSMLVEYWLNAGGGGAVADLTANANFPQSPSLKYFTNSNFELRGNFNESYGTRCRALFFPPVSGVYTFWIASDDSSELWFSPAADGAGKTPIASVGGYTAAREWTKFASQRSPPVPLSAGQPCYLETLHKEGNGGDHLAVAWQGPSPFGGTNLLAATHLRQPFFGFSPPRFALDPLAKPSAVPGSPYTGTLADSVVDTNVNETLVFEKVSGPAWLGVAPDGTLSGLPVPADLGTNSFAVRVTDSTGFSDDATLRVLVRDMTPPDLRVALAGQNVELRVFGAIGQRYRLEFAPGLPAAWQPRAEIAALSSSPWLVLEPATNSPAFYRAVGE